MALSVIIRSYQERTLPLLVKQVKSQLQSGDDLIVLDDQVDFVEKLANMIALLGQSSNKYTLVLDADILIRKNLLKVIKTKCKKLAPSDLGYGILVFDRFYMRPKQRGIHVYTNLGHSVLKQNIAKVANELRPETKLIEIVSEQGWTWQDNLVPYYVGGLHDYYQWYRDIYFKMIIRKYRSFDVVAKLKSKGGEKGEIAAVEAGLRYQGPERLQRIDKAMIESDKIYFEKQHALESKINVDSILSGELLAHYGYSLWFLASKYSSRKG